MPRLPLSCCLLVGYLCTVHLFYTWTLAESVSCKVFTNTSSFNMLNTYTYLDTVFQEKKIKNVRYCRLDGRPGRIRCASLNKHQNVFTTNIHIHAEFEVTKKHAEELVEFCFTCVLILNVKSHKFFSQIHAITNSNLHEYNDRCKLVIITLTRWIYFFLESIYKLNTLVITTSRIVNFTNVLPRISVRCGVRNLSPWILQHLLR